MQRLALILLVSAVVNAPELAFADSRLVDESRDNRTRNEVRRDHEQRRYEAWERQRAREEADARQGGRSGPNAIGPEPYKNPRQSDKPARALLTPDSKK